MNDPILMAIEYCPEYLDHHFSRLLLIKDAFLNDLIEELSACT